MATFTEVSSVTTNDPNPPESNVESLVSAGSSNDELSNEAAESPSRNRRSFSSSKSDVSMAAHFVEQWTPTLPYKPPRRASSGNELWAHEYLMEQRAHAHARAQTHVTHAHVHPHHSPLLLDINQDINPPEGSVESLVSAGSSNDELSSEVSESPSRKGRSLSSSESDVSVAAPFVKQWTPTLPYQPPRRASSGNELWAHEYLMEQRAHARAQTHVTHAYVHPHQTPLLLDINQQYSNVAVGAMGTMGGVESVGNVNAVGPGERAAQPFVCAMALWPLYSVHHIHMQSEGGLVGAALPYEQAQLLVAPPFLLFPPLPMYQVFLNLQAMYLISPYEAQEQSADPEPENYEALLPPAGRPGEAKPRGLGWHEIKQFLTYKYSGQTSHGEQTLCVVCMCEFEAHQMLCVLPCAHEFHVKCVHKWLRSNTTCPICRSNTSDYFNNSE